MQREIYAAIAHVGTELFARILSLAVVSVPMGKGIVACIRLCDPSPGQLPRMDWARTTWRWLPAHTPVHGLCRERTEDNWRRPVWKRSTSHSPHHVLHHARHPHPSQFSLLSKWTSNSLTLAWPLAYEPRIYGSWTRKQHKTLRQAYKEPIDNGFPRTGFPNACVAHLKGEWGWLAIQARACTKHGIHLSNSAICPRLSQRQSHTEFHFDDTQLGVLCMTPQLSRSKDTDTPARLSLSRMILTSTLIHLIK